MKIIILIIVAVAVVSLGYYFLRLRYSPPANLSQVSATPSQTPPASNRQTPAPTPATEISAVIKTQRGNIQLVLYPQIAPKTVGNFVKLAQEKFYDGVKFHRVVPDFVIQAGDPYSRTNDPRLGSGDPGYKFDDEINPRAQGLSDNVIAQLEAKGYKYNFGLKSLPVTVGVIAMANAGPNTNGSQFFIVTTKDQPELNGQYTVFGKVAAGMDIARAIKQGDVISAIEIK